MSTQRQVGFCDTSCLVTVPLCQLPFLSGYEGSPGHVIPKSFIRLRCQRVVSPLWRNTYKKSAKFDHNLGILLRGFRGPDTPTDQVSRLSTDVKVIDSVLHCLANIF